MKTSNFKNIPAGVLLIAAFYIFGAFVLLASFFTNLAEVSPKIAKTYGLSPSLGGGILVLIAALAFVLAYGLISLSRWGFWLTTLYCLYLAVNSLMMGGLKFLWAGQAEQQIPFGTLLWSLFVVIYLSLVRSHFFNPRLAESY